MDNTAGSNPQLAERDMMEVMALAETLFDKMGRTFANPVPIDSSLGPESRLAAQNLLVKRQGFLAKLDAQYKAERVRARASMAEHRKRLNSIAALPDDVLSHIFRDAVLLGRETTVFRLSWTCKRWRTVTIHTPSLWTIMDLTCLTRSQAQLITERSKTCFLHVISSPRLQRLRADWTEAHRLSYCSELHRRTQILDLTVSHVLWDSLPWLRLSPPELREASLELEESASMSAAVLPKLFGDRAPALETLILRNVFVAWDAFSKATSLTKLHVQFHDRPKSRASLNLDATLPSVLGACRSLEDLSLDIEEGLRGVRESNGHVDPIPMPALKRLRLHLPFVSVAALLACIATPPDLFAMDEHSINASLAEAVDNAEFPICLTVREDVPSEWRIDAIVATFQRLRKYHLMPELVQLTLTDLAGSPKFQYEDIILFLRGSPQLAELTLKSCHVDFLRHFVLHRPPNPRIPLCPRLNYVCLSNMTVTLDVLERLCRSLFLDSGYCLQYSLKDNVDADAGAENDVAHGVCAPDVYLSRTAGGVQRQLWLGADVRVEAEGGKKLAVIEGQSWNGEDAHQKQKTESEKEDSIGLQVKREELELNAATALRHRSVDNMN
ncbi:hypothetical protein EIP91_008226 [Steccherinum ochraceum]|uniref:F-box domain-containing protein n=1 Tax=Steccherinum ochraceum TaxID=92696 RepID=A0A4R0RL79_9APHY|nr:hypothetical protein EIP91_008226 [Steccherinum ochraceum]